MPKKNNLRGEWRIDAGRWRRPGSATERRGSRTAVRAPHQRPTAGRRWRARRRHRRRSPGRFLPPTRPDRRPPLAASSRGSWTFFLRPLVVSPSLFDFHYNRPSRDLIHPLMVNHCFNYTFDQRHCQVRCCWSSPFKSPNS